MKDVLIVFGIDSRFIPFAAFVTILTVLIFSLGLPLIVLAQALLIGDNRVGNVLNNVGPGALIILIPSAFFAVKALPFTLPASLVGWAIAFKIAVMMGCSRYYSFISAAVIAATFSSFAFGFWFEFILTVNPNQNFNPSLLVLPSTVLAAVLVSAILYREKRVMS